MAWCKERANEYLAHGDVSNGVTSMLSDLDKHPETRLPEGSPLAMLVFGAALLVTAWAALPSIPDWGEPE